MGIKDYLTALQRRWPIVVVAGLLGLIFGYVVAPDATNQPSAHTSYSATVTLLQAPDVKDPAASTALVVTSDSVAERVSKALTTHLRRSELLPQMTAVADKASNSIKITASNTEPQAAVALANAFAQGTVDEFLARHSDAAAATVQEPGRTTHRRRQPAQAGRRLHRSGDRSRPCCKPRPPRSALATLRSMPRSRRRQAMPTIPRGSRFFRLPRPHPARVRSRCQALRAHGGGPDPRRRPRVARWPWPWSTSTPGPGTAAAARRCVPASRPRRDPQGPPQRLA